MGQCVGHVGETAHHWNIIFACVATKCTMCDGRSTVAHPRLQVTKHRLQTAITDSQLQSAVCAKFLKTCRSSGPKHRPAVPPKQPSERS